MPELTQGSPKTYWLIHFMNQDDKFFELMGKAGKDEVDIDASVAALLTNLPNEPKRRELYEEYLKVRKQLGLVSAATTVVGKAKDYFVETMDIVETATGGFG